MPVFVLTSTSGEAAGEAAGATAGVTALPGFDVTAAPWAAPAVGLIAVRCAGQIAMP